MFFSLCQCVCACQTLTCFLFSKIMALFCYHTLFCGSTEVVFFFFLQPPARCVFPFLCFFFVSTALFFFFPHRCHEYRNNFSLCIFLNGMLFFWGEVAEGYDCGAVCFFAFSLPLQSFSTFCHAAIVFFFSVCRLVSQFLQLVM